MERREGGEGDERAEAPSDERIPAIRSIIIESFRNPFLKRT
jgi:hypothetical protein